MNLFSPAVKEFFKTYPRAIIFVGLSLAMCVIIYFRLQTLPELHETYDKIDHQLAIVLKNAAQGAELAEQLKELKRLTANMPDRLIQGDDKARNYQFFYDIETRSRASISDLKQTTISLGDGVLRPKLEEFSGTGFVLTVSGRVGYVMSFLRRLESGKFFVRCNSVTIKGNPVLGPDAIDCVLKLEVLSKK